MTDAEWIAFLDDDNEFESNHIASLLECAEATGCRAVHSHMQMFHRDGRPFLEAGNPWCSDPDEASKEYEWMVSRGVRTPGSNIIRDSMNPQDHSPVDLGEWLLRRTLLLEIPFCTEYSADDLLVGKHEDDKFLEELVAREERVACTGKPTLSYYLGGYSTRDDGYANPYRRDEESSH